MLALNEMMNYTFVSKYARWIEDEQRRETWKEAVNRVREMMLTKYSYANIDDKINWAYDIMIKKGVLGSQRALQFGGKPALKKNARVYNCVSSYCDRLRFFQETFWLLLCGAGTGFSVQKHHVDKLPELYDMSVQSHMNKPVKEYVIEDTIEGWSNALRVLLDSFFTDAPRIHFKFHEIRPAGSLLSSGVGKAPGPEGLEISLKAINALLLRCLQKNQKRLKPIDAYDIVMHSADAVLSGGVRRSATLCMFSPDDEEMATAKIGNWRAENPQRARSNNSAVLLRGTTTLEQFESLIKNTKEFGEPGFIWVDDLEALFNPCVEIGMWAYQIINETLFNKFSETYDGTGYKQQPEEIGLASGWQGCNLCTINGATANTLDKFLERAEAATIIGTLQAGFTDFDYLGNVSESIFKREALLGVSITGMMEQFDIVLNPANQKLVAKHINKINEEIARAIGINPAARTTCIKPEGTGSNVLGTSAGIHPHHALRYIRFQQANKLENPMKHFRGINPHAVVQSKWADTDVNIMFPIEVPDGSKTKNQLDAVSMLEIVKKTQQAWVQEGKHKDRCTQPWLSHNVSNTITVMDDEWDSVTKFIFKNKKYFSGISLLGSSGDKDYPQAPFTAVYTSRQIVKEYGEAAIWCSGLIEVALTVFNDDLWKACDFALARGVEVDTRSEVEKEFDKLSSALDDIYGLNKSAMKLEEKSNKLKFYIKMLKFSNKYFNGDMKRLTYCMKDVYNWKIFNDLKESFQSVDYKLMREEEDETKLEEQLACSGGACGI